MLRAGGDSPLAWPRFVPAAAPSLRARRLAPERTAGLEALGPVAFLVVFLVNVFLVPLLDIAVSPVVLVVVVVV
jgi:hypothetical protein